jgi:subtilisin family serine protease
MKKVLLIVLILFTANIFPQSKHFIYFKDKGIEKATLFEKNSESYNLALQQLSEKSIQRRIKNMGDEELVTFEDLPLNENYVSQVEEIGIKIENKLNWFNAVTAYLNNEQIEDVKSLSFVASVEPVKTFVFNQIIPEAVSNFNKPTNNFVNFSYGASFGQLQLSEIPIVHSKGLTGEGVLLGLLDTGFDWKNHESLVNANVISEYDFVFKDSSTANDSSDWSDQHAHGTLVFSIVGGFKDSSLIGSAFGSNFLLAKTEDVRSETHLEEDNYAAALEWMERMGVEITSSSLGYSVFDQGQFSYNYRDMDGQTTIVTRAAELAFRRGVVTVTSAGNEGIYPWFYIIAPADGFNTLGVGAVNSSNQVADFSSRGPTSDGRIKPDIVTQGVSVYCAQAGNFRGYINASGTSVAAPIASGIAALLLSAHPHLKNTQVRNILLESADNNTSPDNERGYGLISALDALEFPNLREAEGSFKLTKMFLKRENINPQTVKIHYSTSGEDYTEESMQFDGQYSYTFLFPYLFNGDLVNFYIIYSDLNNNIFRDPVEDVYKFFYGQLDVQLNLDLKKEFTDFVISEPFPNPFIPNIQEFTSIQIKSGGNENLSIVIIDALGQEVETFDQVTVAGTNRIVWMGYSDNGAPVSSGAYYFLIDLNGIKYSRNLILLR